MLTTPEEQFVRLDGDVIFVRRTPIDRNRATILLIHGLGESGLCFSEIFHQQSLQHYNLVVPDNVGYGRSSNAANNDYSFVAQIGRLKALLCVLGVENVVLVGHSLGGMLVSIWAAMNPDPPISCIVNIEGNLTPQDVSVSKQIYEAFTCREYNISRWSNWAIEEFMHDVLLSAFGTRWPRSYRRYCASLWFARPEAFVENAREIVERSSKRTPEGLAEIGSQYASIQLPKIFYYGSCSICPETLTFLKREELQNREFAGSFHWPMLDCPEEFYEALAAFANSALSAPKDLVQL